MYDKFGKMTYEDLMKAIDGQIQEGDLSALKELAEENGLKEELVLLAAETGETEVIDAFTVAACRLDMEARNCKSRLPVQPVADYLKAQCMDYTVLAAVMKKDKDLNTCMETIEEKAKKVVTGQKPYLADQIVFDWAMEYYVK